LNAELLKLETAHQEKAPTTEMPSKVKGAPAA
jgi:hypothetical protein